MQGERLRYHTHQYNIKIQKALRTEGPVSPRNKTRPIATSSVQDLSATKRKLSTIRSDMVQIMASRRGFGVSDPRDMVFAHDHLGLIERAIGIKVDYQQSTAQLYNRVAMQAITRTMSIETLSIARDISLLDRRKSLASWAPDWEISPSTHSKRIFDFCFQREDGFDDSDLLPQFDMKDFPLRYKFVDERILCVRCTLVAAVTHLSNIMNPLTYEPIKPVFDIRAWQMSRYKRPAILEESLEPICAWWNKVLGPDSSLLLDTECFKNDLLYHRNPTTTILEQLVNRLKNWNSESIVDGRRLAKLDNDQLALVPAFAKLGDIIASPERNERRTAFTFRDCTIVNEAKTTDKILDIVQNVDRTRIRHVKLIGECFGEYVLPHPIFPLGDFRFLRASKPSEIWLAIH